MKKLVHTSLLLVLGMVCYAQDVRFSSAKNWQEAQSLAKSSNKLLMVDFFATWCGPCKKMDKEVFTESELAGYINQQFVAVKVQLDKTGQDDEVTKSWYNDAEALQKKYGITELPTYLFFDQYGKLIHRVSGFHNPKDFLGICKTAADPVNNYAGLLQQYRDGKLKGQALYDLAMQAKSYKDDSLALEIIKKYRRTYLDKLPLAKQLSPQLLRVFAEIPYAFNVDDKLIKFVYKNPALTDSVLAQKGVSKRLVNYMITRDIINPVLFPVENKVEPNPDWSKMENLLTKRYDRRTMQENILSAKPYYYQKQEDWNRMIGCWFEKLDTLGINMNEGFNGVEVNNTIYDIIFKRSNDPGFLDKSIYYMEELLKVTPNSSSRLDTYASVLYKRGRRDEAIAIEKKAMAIAEEQKDAESVKLFQELITKMQEGKPTWE